MRNHPRAGTLVCGSRNLASHLDATRPVRPPASSPALRARRADRARRGPPHRGRRTAGRAVRDRPAFDAPPRPVCRARIVRRHALDAVFRRVAAHRRHPRPRLRAGRGHRGGDRVRGLLRRALEAAAPAARIRHRGRARERRAGVRYRGAARRAVAAASRHHADDARRPSRAAACIGRPPHDPERLGHLVRAVPSRAAGVRSGATAASRRAIRVRQRRRIARDRGHFPPEPAASARQHAARPRTAARSGAAYRGLSEHLHLRRRRPLDRVALRRDVRSDARGCDRAGHARGPCAGLVSCAGSCVSGPRTRRW